MKVEKVVSVEIDCDDVIEFISLCSSGSEIQRICDAALDDGADAPDCDHEDIAFEDIEAYNRCASEQGYIQIESLADEMKMEFITSVWDKYSLEQLEEKLK